MTRLASSSARITPLATHPLTPADADPGVLHEHQSRRGRAALAIQRLAEIAEESGAILTAGGQARPRGEVLAGLADKLQRNEFVLAVVGEFSRGKSSLINALLEQPDLLPTAIEPSTSAVTVLTYGPEPRIRVTFDDGTTVEHPGLGQLMQYVQGSDLDGRSQRAAAAQLSETDLDLEAALSQHDINLGPASQHDIDLSSSPDLELPPVPRPSPDTHTDISLSNTAPDQQLPQVQTVHVELPSPFLQEGVCLVDTPGLSSVNPRHSEATRQYIDQADAVIFLVNTDPVIGQSECDFLAFLENYVERFLFVVTKTDRYSPREQEQSLEYTRRVIRQHAGLEAPPVYAVSSRLALEGKLEDDAVRYAASGFPEFLRGLGEFLVQSRGEEFVRRQVGAARHHLQALRNAAVVELQGLEGGPEALPGRIEATRQALADADRRRREILDELGWERSYVAQALEVFNPVARTRLEMTLIREVGQAIDGYDWKQLQRAPHTLPVLLRDLLHIQLQPDIQAVSRQVMSLRDKVLPACRNQMGEINRRLAMQFEGLRLPDQVDVSLDFDATEFSERLWKMGTLTVGYTVVLTVAGLMALGGLGAVVLLGGYLAQKAMASVVRNQVKARLKANVPSTLSRLVGELFHKIHGEVNQSVDQFEREVDAFLRDSVGCIERSLARLEQWAASGGQGAEKELESPQRQEQLRVRLVELEQLEAELV